MRRLVKYTKQNDNGREQVLVAVELPKYLRWLAFTKFGRYENWERVGWGWYDKYTGIKARSDVDDELDGIVEMYYD